MGNKMMTQMANILYDSYLSDMHTCLKLMPLDVFMGLNLTERGFGLDTQVTALLLRSGVRPFEVPISYHSRSRAQGKKISWRDAVKCMLDSHEDARVCSRPGGIYSPGKIRRLSCTSHPESESLRHGQ